MSIFSDYKCGALSEDEFKSECARMNAEDRYDQEHMWDRFCDNDEESEDEFDEADD